MNGTSVSLNLAYAIFFASGENQTALFELKTSSRKKKIEDRIMLKVIRNMTFMQFYFYDYHSSPKFKIVMIKCIDVKKTIS